MIRHKEIKLIPSFHKLDVYIVGNRYNHNAISKNDRKSIASIFHAKYGGGYEYWYENTKRVNEVFDTVGDKSSEHESMRRIIMIINPSIEVLVHEIVHVLWFLAKLSGLDMDYKSQEWQACMQEYIFTEVKNFKKIPIFEMKRQPKS